MHTSYFYRDTVKQLNFIGGIIVKVADVEARYYTALKKISEKVDKIKEWFMSFGE